MHIHCRPMVACVLALLVASTPVVAGGLTDCRALISESDRLTCYDRLADEQQGVSSASEVSRNFPAAQTVGLRRVAPGHSAADEQGVATERAANLQYSSQSSSSLLGTAWELDPGQRGHTLRIRQYKPVYLLPMFYASRPNDEPSSPATGHSTSSPLDLDSREAKLQISLKSKLFEDVFGQNGDLWFGYTQSSHWQVYNGNQSRPFRETSYEPELMFVWRTDYDLLGWRGRLVNLGLNHQSNGRALPLSRSWNRVMLSTSLERDNWTMTLRPWWRIPENASRDDNPDIADYMGRADLQLVRTSGDHQLSLLLRHSLRGGGKSRGAVQLDYAFPISGDLRGHVQWLSGYGESLIDYNHRGNYIGLGVSLLEWY